MSRTAFIFSTACIFFTVQVYAEVTQKEDRFTGDITYKAQAKPNLDGELHAVILVTVKKGGGTSAIIELASGRRGWRYLQCYETHWLLDGRRIEMPPATHDGQVLPGGYVAEFVMELGVPMDTLRLFSRAKLVEYKVCNDEGRFSESEMADLKELVSELPK